MNVDRNLILKKPAGIKILLANFLFQFFLAGPMARGQSYSPDRLYAQLDKPFYISGETLQFSVYAFNEGKSPSRLIHADLVNRDGKIIARQLLRLENNTSHGALSIPLSEAGGWYLLRIYSIWNLNFNESFNFLQPIPVYNDFDMSGEDYLPDDSVTIRDEDIHQWEKGDLEIYILNKEPIHTRDSILLNIRLPIRNRENLAFSGSVSVLDLETAGREYETSILSSWEKQNHLSTRIKSLDYEPEDSILIMGHISETGTGMPVNSRVLSVYNQLGPGFSRIEGLHGSFSFKLPAFRGSTFLQVINMNPFQPVVNRVVPVDLPQRITFPDTLRTEVKINKAIRNYLYYSRLRKKINEIYDESFFDSIPFKEPEVLPFTPDRSYRMENYQLLSTLEDFIREGITNSSHILENGKKKILLYNQETKKFFMRSPWFLVDGYFVFDDSITHHLPFNTLRQVDIYNTNQSILKYFDPIMVQGGVVAVYTKNQILMDYVMSQPNTLQIKGLAPDLNNRAYQNPSLDSRIYRKPDLNPLIYWEPGLQFGEDGTAVITIPANDLSGYYLIHVEGMDTEGKPFFGRRVIKVLP